MLAEELHRKYRADLAEAKSRDRREASLVFLDTVVEIGKFEVASLTIRRYVLLDHLQSPFLLGCANRLPTKEDVIVFLWIMNPNFDPRPKKARQFARRNFFRLLRWRKLAMEIADLIIKSMESMEMPSSEKSNEGPNPEWVAQIVDGAASQYGWSETQIFDLPLSRAMAYMRALAQRLEGTKSVHFSQHSDKVRDWYRKQVIKATNKDE